MKQKAYFIIFKGFSVARNCVRPDSAPLSYRSVTLVEINLYYSRFRRDIFILITELADSFCCVRPPFHPFIKMIDFLKN